MKKNTLLLLIIAVGIILVYLFIGGGLKRGGNVTGDNADFYADEQLAAQAGCSGSTTPTITAINASGITSGSATLTWTTNMLANSEAKFWTAPQTANSVNWLPVTDASGVLSHTYQISGLQPSKTYSYRVRSSAVPSGCRKTSTTKTFTTLAGSTTAPLAATNLSATVNSCNAVTLNWTASAGATGYEVYGPNSACSVNGSAGYCGSTTGTSLSLANLAENKTYTGSTGQFAGFTVLAYNSAGYATPTPPRISATTPVCGSVDTQAPTTSTAAPSGTWATTNISRTLTCTDGTATGASGCAATYWQFVAINATCPAAGSTSYSTGTTASTTTNGGWRLCFYSRDNANNVENPIKSLSPFQLDSVAPTGSITAPAANATVSGTAVTLSATASDALSGVSGVSFRIDGSSVATDTTSPYSVTWNSTTVANGTHTLTGFIADLAGNTYTTPARTFTVSNITTTAPATPTGVAVGALTCDLTTNKVNTTLTWNASSGATSYEVYGPTSATSCPAGTCGVATANSLAITGLTPNTTFSGTSGAAAGITVLARNAVGYSAGSPRLTFTTPSCSTNTAPVVTITGPTTASTYATSTNYIVLSGTASDNVSVSSITYTNQTSGFTATSTGTTAWSTANIPLWAGANTLVVTATDNMGLTSTDTLTVTFSSMSALPWPASTTGTSLTGGAEPSGAFWNPVDQKLYIVSDSGTITRQNQDGSGAIEIASGLGNLEGITGTSAANPSKMNYLYVIDEDLVRLREFNPYVTATTGAYTGNYWNLIDPGSIPSNDVLGNDGIEGVAFVPDFTPTGPYGNSQFTTGGLFYVSSQLTGKVYVLDIDLRTSNIVPQRRATIIPNLRTLGSGSADISDLYYATATNKLFVLYDALGVVHEMRTNGTIVNEYRSPLGNAGEGITTIPTCSGTTTSIVLAYDQGTVSRYSNYPQPCADVTPPTISSVVPTIAGNAVTVTWNTNEISDSIIEFGIGNYTLSTVNVSLKITGHTVAATGLPNGNYQYRVKSKDEAGNASSYTTGNFIIGSTAVDPIVYAAGDIAISSQTGRMQTSNWMLGNLTNVAAILTLGDNAYPNGTLTDFNNYYAPSWGRAALLALTKPSPGNHEYQTTNASGYFDYFNGSGVQNGRAGDRTKGYYSYNVGNWHLIALNTNDKCTVVGCGVGSTQEQWLRADLAANSGMCTIAYGHHPRFSYNDHQDTTEIQALWDALADNNVELYLSGHDHGYEVKKKMNSAGTVVTNGIGVRQMVIGTGGTNEWYTVPSGPNYPNQETAAGSAINNTYGILKLTLKASSYDWAFVRTSDGAILNSGSEACY
jgi:hypothetical protein